jgi:hypothetical protein
MVEFVPSWRSPPSIHSNEHHAKQISITLDDSLYILHTMDSRLFEVELAFEFRAMAFGRNSIYFGSFLF